MRDISVGIFHKDYQYGKRLMEYLNHQKEFPMTAWFASDEKQFFDTEKERQFHCLVLAEGVDDQGRSPVCRIGRTAGSVNGHCQSGRDIAKKIYDCLQIKREGKDMIVGVYSPLSRYQVSQFAQRFAGERGFAYFGMQAYGHWTEICTADELLLLYIKERNETVIQYFLDHQSAMGECSGYPAVGCYLDYRAVSLEDYRWFFERLKEERISVLFDIGAACPPKLGFLGLFDKIYVPLMKGDRASSEYVQFKDQMKRHGIWYQTTWEEVILAAKETGKEQEE